MEAQPQPARAALRATSREWDGAAAPRVGGVEAAIKTLSELPEKERTMALMKVSLANPDATELLDCLSRAGPRSTLRARLSALRGDAPRRPTHCFLMSQEARMSLAAMTQETLELMKASLAKNVTISTGLSAYDLQAPAKNLFPIITPLRNSLPRVQRQNPGDAARWRTIASITGSGYDAMGWVPEGQRSASMSYVATPMVAPYVTLGEEDTVTFEAEAAAQGFEDVNSTATLRLLQKTMRKEEQRAARRQRLGRARHAAGAGALRLRAPARRCPPPPIP